MSKLDYKKYENNILERVGEKRYKHMLRVAQSAKMLAQIHKADVEKAELAGYLHDCAKLKNKEDYPRLCQEFGLSLSQDMKKAPAIIHGFLGAKLAEKLYEIKDIDILNAISYHTTGRENMSTLEKIIFLADYIEPKRDFPQAKQAREIAKVNLDKAMFYVLDENIKNLIELKNYIALDTIKARNYYLEKNEWKVFLKLSLLLFLL